MKTNTIIFLVVLLLIGQNVNAKLNGTLRMGTDPTTNICFTDINVFYPFPIGCVRFVPYGGMRCIWWNESFMTGSPFRDIYTCGSRIEWKDFSIGAEHFCNHAVKSFHSSRDSAWYSQTWGENFTSVYIEIKF